MRNILQIAFGVGEVTLCGHDRWCDEVILKDRLLNLYNVSNDGMGLLRLAWCGWMIHFFGVWTPLFRRNLLLSDKN